HEELDFVHEAANIRAFLENHRNRPYMKIPRVYDALSSRTVLTLEFVRGVKISQAELSMEDRREVAGHILDASFRQLFEDGLFHGDPHPGNVLVLPENRIALLDFGLVGRLTRAQQEALVTLIVAVALRDADTVARVLNRIGVPEAHAPIAEFRADIAAILDRYLGLRLDEIRTATLLRDLLDLAVQHRIRIPKEYAVLAKASVTVEGIVRRLYPRLDMREVGLPYAKELLLARFNPSDASTVLLKTVLKLQSIAEDVPAQLSQILVDLESGKFRVNVHSEPLDRIATHVRSLGVMVFLGAGVAGFTVSGFLVLATGARDWLGLVALGAAGALAAIAGLYHGATGKVPKVSIRRFLRR
ncbi:MAG TPA: AarF/UbiB family protein, partial [Anaeromyxobacteraceae bacterium]|nr:AarF/UbiB family protein [Anaeromyxobacteraceae bacterium]